MKPSKKLFHTGMSISLAVAIIGGGGIAIANADDVKPYQAVLTQAETQSLQASYDGAVNQKMTGQILDISIPDKAEAQRVKDLGINIDFAGSVDASNAYNARTDIGHLYPTVGLKADFNVDTFKQNSPLGSTALDVELGLANGDRTFSANNVYMKDKLPNGLDLPLGTMTNGDGNFTDTELDGFPGVYEMTHASPGASFTQGGVPNDLNGNTEPEVSQMTNTWILDNYAPSEQREADLTINGQRGILASGLMDCISSEQASCGLYVTPTANGNFKLGTDDETQEGTMAIAEGFWLEVKLSIQAMTPIHTKANPFVAESGDSVYFEAIDASTDVTNIAGEYNLLNPNIAIKPWQYATEAGMTTGWNNPEVLFQSNVVDGKTVVGLSFNTPFAGDNIVGTVSNGSNALNKIITVSNDNPQAGDTWTYNGADLKAGDDLELYGVDGAIKVVSATKGELVLDVSSEEESVTYAFNTAFIGTSVAWVGKSSQTSRTNGYTMVSVKGDLPEIPEIPTPEEPEIPTPEEPEIPTPEEPEIPTPEVPVTPEETPEEPVTPEEPTVVDDGTIDDIVLTDDGMVDDLAETGARDTGLMAWIASMMVGLGLGGIVLFGRKPHTAKK